MNLDLELADTDDLVAELAGRYDVFAMVGAKIGMGADGTSLIQHQVTGPRATVIGLLADLQHDLMHQCGGTPPPGPDGEPPQEKLT